MSIKSLFLKNSDIEYVFEKNIIEENLYKELKISMKKEIRNALDIYSLFINNDDVVIEQIEQYYKQLSDNSFKNVNTAKNILKEIFYESLLNFVLVEDNKNRKNEFLNICNFLTQERNSQKLEDYNKILSIIRILSSNIEEVNDIMEENGFFIENYEVEKILKNFNIE